MAMRITVRVVNPTKFKRYAVATTVVAFAPAEYEPDDWALEQVEPFGPLNPDGSVRHARVRFPVWLEPHEERDEVLPRMPRDNAVAAGLGQAKAAQFQFHRNITPATLLGVKLDLRDGGLALNLLAGLVPIEAACGSMVQQFRSPGRMGSDVLWGELTMELYTEAPYVRWWLLSGYNEDSDVRVDGCGCKLHTETTTAEGHKILNGVLLFATAGGSVEDASTLEAEAIAPTTAVADRSPKTRKLSEPDEPGDVRLRPNTGEGFPLWGAWS